MDNSKVGLIKTEGGVIITEKNYKVVKMIKGEGAAIPSHNHPEANLLVTVVKGKVVFTLNETETHELVPGMILQFDGNHFASIKFLEASEFFVTLIDKAL